MSDFQNNHTAYQAAGGSLPGRDIADGKSQEMLEGSQAEPMSTAEGKATSIIIFRLRSTWLALKTSLLHKVVDFALPHSIPKKTDTCFRGIVNAGGDLELCFSLADVLAIADQTDENLGNCEGRKSPRLIVVGEGINRFAFAVDDILGIRSVSIEKQTTSQETPATSVHDEFLKIIDIEGKSVGLLLDEILFDVLRRSVLDGHG
jgi:chemotaxis signal transduction protein